MTLCHLVSRLSRCSAAGIDFVDVTGVLNYVIENKLTEVLFASLERAPHLAASQLDLVSSDCMRLAAHSESVAETIGLIHASRVLRARGETDRTLEQSEVLA